MNLPRLTLFCCLFVTAIPAFAAAGDDRSIMKYCGHADGEHRDISPVTNQLQRDLYYPGDVVFHFQPVDGGWSLSGAWIKHLPVTREGAANRFTCIRDALAESSAAPRVAYDPTIAAQTAAPRAAGDTFGIPYFWLIVVLALTLLLVVFVPSARQRAKPQPLPTPRAPQRKPSAIIEAERASAAYRQVEP